MKLLKILIPCLLLSACALGRSKNAKYYTHLPISASGISSTYNSSVGVNRVQLPKYIDRPQIVTQQKDSSQVKISEFNRWVESPTMLTTRALTNNLSILLTAAQVKHTRSNGDKFDRTISVEVVRMTAILGDHVELIAWYTIKDDAKKTLVEQKFASTAQIGKTYDDLAEGYNKLLAELSQEIARKLISQ